MDEGRASGPRRNAAVLALCVLAAIVLLGTIARLTDEPIETARTARLGETLAAVLPATPFDNDPASDVVTVADAALGDETSRSVYRARLGERDVGAVLGVVAPNGYSGPIELLVGVDASGRISAVRVVSHRETPGLGDRIERRRTDWIAQFDGRTLESGDPDAWRVVRRGANDDIGFDALSGATITSRAIVDAVHGALRWFEANRDAAFAR